MDFVTKELFKRYAGMVVGRPASPVFLNILVTSVCDMRCTHCFFTEELELRIDEVTFTWENDRQGSPYTTHSTYSFDIFVRKYEEYSLYDN